MITDKDRIDFLEATARLSKTGVSFDWSGEKEYTGYRFLSRHHISEPRGNIRDAIDTAINEKRIVGRVK